LGPRRSSIRRLLTGSCLVYRAAGRGHYASDRPQKQNSVDAGSTKWARGCIMLQSRSTLESTIDAGQSTNLIIMDHRTSSGTSGVA